MRAKAQADLPLPPPAEPDTRKLRAIGVVTYQDHVLPKVTAAIDRITAKEAASLFDAQPSYISDALAGRNNKGPRIEWLVHLLISAPRATKLELITELNRIAGYKPPERSREIDEAEEFRIWKRVVKRDYPGALAAIEREVEES